MSMDLFLWKAPITGDPEEAAALLKRYFEDDDKEVFEPSEDVVRVLDLIREAYLTTPRPARRSRRPGHHGQSPTAIA